MVDIYEVLEKTFLGNALMDYLIAFSIFILALIVFKIFREVILKKLKKLADSTETDLDNTFIEIIRSLRPPFYVFLSIYFSLFFIDIANNVSNFINYILIIWVGYQVIVALSILIDYVIKKKISSEEEPNTQSAIRLFGNILKGAVWVIILLFVLSNMGVNITSLVGALGVGGIAIALAVQNILNDLFSSFAIYFDKPFEVGDFVMVGEHMGVVQYIGVKTTRLTALQGEEIVISNQELTSVRVQNFKKLKERRVVFNFGVTYETSNKVLKKIPSKIEKIIDSVEMARFDRAHFHRFDDSALVFEIVYYLLSPEYNDYMDTQQEINIKIKEAVEKEGVSFAYPTRTIYTYNK